MKLKKYLKEDEGNIDIPSPSFEYKNTYSTRDERRIKKRLINLLHTQKHDKYAKRLELFTIKVVPISVDPDFTAAISFADGIIFISEGLLINEATFRQLDMLMRHELSHNLLMHEIRMTNKIGKQIYPELSPSHSLHELLNIIEDFDISNTRYTENDKILVRHTHINGKEISGLVTEDIIPDWKTLSLEDMYIKLNEKLAKIKQDILTKRALENSDYVDKQSLEALGYFLSANKPQEPSIILNGTAKDFINDDATIWGMTLNNMPEQMRTSIIKINELISDPNSYYNDIDHINELIKQIADTNPFDICLVKALDKKGIEDTSRNVRLQTPEIKRIAVEYLKKYLSDWKSLERTSDPDYIKAFNLLMSKFNENNLTDEEITAIKAAVTGGEN